MTNRIDDIEKYLAEELAPNERQSFEREMAQDEQLQATVRVMRDMARALQPDPSDAFLENLARAERPYRARLPYWWFLLTPLLLLIGFWLWPNPQPVKIQDAPNKTLPLDTSPSSRPPTKDVAPPALSEPPPVSPPPPPIKTKKPVAPPPVLAANFLQNPLLEAEMRDNLRGGELAISAISVTVKTADDQTKLRFSASLTTQLPANEISLQLLLLDNKVASYQYSRHLATVPLPVSATATGYAFDLEQNLDLPPGLYYYLIEWIEAEEAIKIGKFTVDE